MELYSTTVVQARELAKLSPEKLSQSSSLTDDAKAEELGYQFEALLLKKILNDAQKPLFGGGLIKSDAVNSIYQDQVTTQLADAIVHSSSIGLAPYLRDQLVQQSKGTNAPTANEFLLK